MMANKWTECTKGYPTNYTDVEAITDTGKKVIAWIDRFESADDGDYFNWEWHGRKNETIVKWRSIPKAKS